MASPAVLVPTSEDKGGAEVVTTTESDTVTSVHTSTQVVEKAEVEVIEPVRIAKPTNPSREEDAGQSFKDGKDFKTIEGFLVSVQGNFGVGKSFFINAVVNNTRPQLPSAHEVSTAGISAVISSVRGQSVIFCDTAGRNAAVPVKSDEDFDGALSEQTFQIELLGRLCPNQVLVVGKLSLQDQKSLREMTSKADAGTTIFVVHNLRHVRNDFQFKTELENVCSLLAASDDVAGEANRVSRQAGTKFSHEGRAGTVLQSSNEMVFVEWTDTNESDVFALNDWIQKVDQRQIKEEAKRGKKGTAMGAMFALHHYRHEMNKSSPNDYVKENGIPFILGTCDRSKVTQYHFFFWYHHQAEKRTALEDSSFAFNTATCSFLKDTICNRGIPTTTRSDAGAGKLGVLNYPAEVFKALAALVPQYWKVDGGHVDIIVTKQKMEHKECPQLLERFSSAPAPGGEEVGLTLGTRREPHARASYFSDVRTLSPLSKRNSDHTFRPQIPETEGDADKVASMQASQQHAKQVFDLTFNPEMYYNFVLYSARPGGDFRDLNSEGLIFRVNRMHMQNKELESLAANETWVWTLKVRHDARFMPNAVAQTVFSGVGDVDAPPQTEETEELNFNKTSCRWSSYQREILSNGAPVKQKLFVIDTAGCELVNECNTHYVPAKNGKVVKAVRMRYANGSKMTLDTSQLKPRDARTLLKTLTSDSENPLTWTNVTRKESEKPEWSNQECRWPVDFNPDPKATKVVQHGGQLLIAVQSALDED